MSNSSNSHAQHVAPIDDLVTQLLECGGALSQIISGMVRFASKSAGDSVPDLAPIPVVAHGLIRSVIDDLPERHSQAQIRAAAQIVKEVTAAICSEIYAVPFEELYREDVS